MAGRIRSIKPEILDDSKCAALTHLEFRLFVGSWLIADDYGNLRGDPDYIRGQIVWGASESRETVAKALETLAGVTLLVPYAVRGQPYLHIAGWDKHQKLDRPGKARMPGRDEADCEQKPLVETDSRDPRETHENIRETHATDLRPPTSDQDPERELRDGPPALSPDKSVSPIDSTTSDLRGKRSQFRKTIRQALEEGRQRAAKALRKRYIPLLAFDRGLISDLEQHVAITQTSDDLAQLEIQALHAVYMCELSVVSGQEDYRWFTGAVFTGGNFAKYAAMSEDEARRGPKPKSAADARSEEQRRLEASIAHQWSTGRENERRRLEREAKQAEEALTDPSKRIMTPDEVKEWMATEGKRIWEEEPSHEN